MDQRGEYQPEAGARVLSLQHSHYNPDRRRSRKRPRIHVLVHDVESSARHRYGQQRRDQSRAAISCSRAVKADSSQFPAAPQQSKNAGELPCQQGPFERQMRNPDRPCNQVWKQGELCVTSEKSIVKRIERRIEQFLDPRHVDLRVFNKRVIAMDGNRSGAEQKQNDKIFWTCSSDHGISIRGILRINFGGWLQCRAHNSRRFPAPVSVPRNQKFDTSPAPTSAKRIAAWSRVLQSHTSRCVEN